MVQYLLPEQHVNPDFCTPTAHIHAWNKWWSLEFSARMQWGCTGGLCRTRSFLRPSNQAQRLIHHLSIGTDATKVGLAPFIIVLQ